MLACERLQNHDEHASEFIQIWIDSLGLAFFLLTRVELVTEAPAV